MNAVEADLRGQVVMTIAALMGWAHRRGDAARFLVGQIETLLYAAAPFDDEITQAFARTGAALSRYIGEFGCVPKWVPDCLLDVIGGSSLGAAIASVSDTGSEALGAGDRDLSDVKTTTQQKNDAIGDTKVRPGSGSN